MTEFETIEDWADAGLTALAVGELDDAEEALRQIKDTAKEDDG